MDVSESSPAIYQLRLRSAQKPQLSPVTVRQLGLQREFWVPWFSRLSCSRSKSVNQRRMISPSRGKLKATFCRIPVAPPIRTAAQTAEVRGSAECRLPVRDQQRALIWRKKAAVRYLLPSKRGKSFT